MIEPNEKVLELFSQLKPLILRLSDVCITLRNWIVILIPKAEDGNNFGVEVQEQCIVKLIGIVYECESDQRFKSTPPGGGRVSSTSHPLKRCSDCSPLILYTKFT